MLIRQRITNTGIDTFGTSAPMRGYCGMPAAMRALDVMNTPKVPSSGSTSESREPDLDRHFSRGYLMRPKTPLAARPTT